MINFVICDDDKKCVKKVKEILDRYMMRNQIEYKAHLFYDYDDSFMEFVERRLPFTIYILDIEMPTRSGIDVARIIRKKDVNCLIIFLTGHEELGEVVLKDEFMFLSFINKFDDSEQRLVRTVTRALKLLKVRPKIKFKDNGVVYTLALDDIIYITRDSVDRKCIIKTDNSEFKIGKSLSEIMKMLNANFVQTHRSCIVNSTRVSAVSKGKKRIVFDNGETIDLISDNFSGELI